MEKILNKERLEKLLLKNWTTFLDNKKLIAFVLSTIKDQKFNNVVSKSPVLQKNLSIKLSKFEFKENGFIIWVEFSIPRQGGTLVGTTEFALQENLTHIQTIGTLFSNNVETPD